MSCRGHCCRRMLAGVCVPARASRHAVTSRAPDRATRAPCDEASNPDGGSAHHRNHSRERKRAGVGKLGEGGRAAGVPAPAWRGGGSGGTGAKLDVGCRHGPRCRSGGLARHGARARGERKGAMPLSKYYKYGFITCGGQAWCLARQTRGRPPTVHTLTGAAISIAESLPHPRIDSGAHFCLLSPRSPLLCHRAPQRDARLLPPSINLCGPNLRVILRSDLGLRKIGSHKTPGSQSRGVTLWAPPQRRPAPRAPQPHAAR